MKSYVEIRHQSLRSQLYIHLDGSNLTRYQFGAVLQSTLSFCDARAKADENILAAYTDEHT
jgi:hypothetical protein